MNETDARKLYNSLPQFKEVDGRQYQKKPDFNNVKSFYANGMAVLIQGRVTSETAIEEVLHPFINAVEADQNTLFNNLNNLWWVMFKSNFLVNFFKFKKTEKTFGFFK